MKYFKPISLIVFLVINCVECNNTENSAEKKPEAMKPKLKEENITYTGDSITMNGFVVYDESKEAARPAVLVVHEWWGLNDYTKMRARELAKLGYIAFALDMYGEGRQANDPGAAQKMAEPFYKDPQMAKTRFDAALNKLKTYPQADSNRIAAIGYCFGGTQVLNMAKMGDNLKGVVSFHGGLAGVIPQKNLTKADVLVCHGADDQFVPQAQVDQFKKQMDSVGASYTFKAYAGATHAFSNPQATEIGKKFNLPIAYNAAADTASWSEMKSFFGKIFK